MASFIVSSSSVPVSPPDGDSHNGNDLPSASSAASASRAAAPSPSPTAAKALPAGGSALARAARRATTAIDTLESAPASSRTTKLACAGTIAGSSATQTAALTAHTLTGTVGDTGAIGCGSASEILSALFSSSAILLSGLDRIRRARPVEFLRRPLVAVRNAFAVFRIVLPLSLSVLIELSPFLELLLGLVSVDIVINSSVAVDVDIDLAPVPVGTAPGVAPRRAHGRTRGKGKRSGCSYVTGRVVVIRRISRVGPGAVHHCWIIGRYINDLRTGRFDLDDLFLDDYDLLFGRLEIA